MMFTGSMSRTIKANFCNSILKRKGTVKLRFDDNFSSRFVSIANLVVFDNSKKSVSSVIRSVVKLKDFIQNLLLSVNCNNAKVLVRYKCIGPERVCKTK